MTITFQDAKRISGLSTDTVETPTFSNDFSSSAGWITTDAYNFSVDTANSELDFAVNGSTSALDRIFYDLGSGSISDTSWVLRIHQLKFSQISTYMNLAIVLSSTNTGKTSVQDGLGVWLMDGGDANDYAFPMIGNDSGMTYQNPSFFTGQLATNTDYYVEIIRVTATTMKINIFTTAFTGTPLVTTIRDISSGITNLRYLKIMEPAPEAGDYPNTYGVGTIQKVEFFNNVTSVNSKPTNVASGSIFLETNLGRRYFSNANVWTRQLVNPIALRAGVSYTNSSTLATYKWFYNTDTEVGGTAFTGVTPFNGASAFGTESVGYFAAGSVNNQANVYTKQTKKYTYSNDTVSTAASTANFHGWGGEWSRPDFGYVVKGNSGGAYGTSVEKFSFSSETYSLGTNMNASSQVGTHQSTTIGYGTGRWHGAVTGDTQKYTFSNDSVTSGTNMLVPSAVHGTSTCSAHGLLAGGMSQNSPYPPISRIEKYSHSDDVVTNLGESLSQASDSSEMNYGSTENAYFFNVGNTTVINKISNTTFAMMSSTLTSITSGGQGHSTTTGNEVMF